MPLRIVEGFSGGSVVKNPPAKSELGLDPGSGKSPGGGLGNPLQYSCLENPMDRGVLWFHGSQVHKESDTKT